MARSWDLNRAIRRVQHAETPLVSGLSLSELTLSLRNDGYLAVYHLKRTDTTPPLPMGPTTSGGH